MAVELRARRKIEFFAELIVPRQELSLNVAQNHTRLKSKTEANMESKICCVLLLSVWYLLNVVSCGPAENRGPGVTGGENQTVL